MRKLSALHLDFKAAHVLVRRSGAVVITNLRIATKLLDGVPSVITAQLSHDHTVPEAREEGRCCLASEVHSLGITLMELLCGTTRCGAARMTETAHRKRRRTAEPPF